MSYRSEPLLGFSPEAFRARRERALAALEGSALVLPAAPAAHKSRDTERRYRADSELFYLTGVVEPGVLAVLEPPISRGANTLEKTRELSLRTAAGILAGGVPCPRERALAALEGSALVLPAAPAAHKSRDTERRYRRTASCST